MDRRRFLAVLGGAVTAGCSAPEASVGTEPQTLTPVEVPATETRTPESAEPFASRGPFGEASVVNLNTGPRTLALSPVRYQRDDLLVELRFTATATVTQPARLALALTNRSETPTRVDLARVPPLGTVLSPVEHVDGSTPETSVGRLVVPTDGTLGSQRPRIERGPDGYWRASVSPPALPDELEVEAGETRTGTVLLLGDPGARGFPFGRYVPSGSSSPLALVVWDTGAPGPRSDSRFDGRQVPPLPNTVVTDWYHEATSRTGIFLRPSVERGGSPTTFRFALVNHTVDPLGGNPEDWKLYKLVDGTWYRIAPWAIELAAGPLPPGGTFDYAVAAAHGPPPACECTATGAALGHLGGGLYALEAGYSRVQTSETYAAMVRFDAPDVQVEPTGDATVERRGERTVVTHPGWEGSGRPPDATMTVSRAPGMDARRLIPEQVYRRPYRALRDVVPHLSETPVVLRSVANLVGEFFGRRASRRAFEYGDETYLAERGAETATTEIATESS